VRNTPHNCVMRHSRGDWAQGKGGSRDSASAGSNLELPKHEVPFCHHHQWWATTLRVEVLKLDPHTHTLVNRTKHTLLCVAAPAVLLHRCGCLFCAPVEGNGCSLRGTTVPESQKTELSHTQRAA